MKTGDIILIPFPFSKLTDVKVRPAVVASITIDKYNDLVLCAISSQIPAIPTQNEIVMQPEKANGLRVASVIKVDRIFTLKKEKVISRIGALNVRQLQEFKTAFKSLVEE